MIMENLQKRAIDKSPLCVGIDLRQEHIPFEITNGGFDVENHFVEYAKAIVDLTTDVAACYKVQIACYEAFGIPGLKADKEILKYIRSKGEYVIADIKRSDIGSTAKMYAKAHFEGELEADIVTLNPFMGKDSISPYFDYFKKGKGAFILAKTTNEGSKDFQDLIVGNRSISSTVLDKVYEWSKELGDFTNFPNMGAVVGVNNASSLNALKESTDKLFLLIPGYGAQGAKLEDIKYLMGDKMNGVVNVSRGISGGLSEDRDFRKSLRERALKLAKELRY